MTSWDLTTVADDEAVAFAGTEVQHWVDLDPDRDYNFDGLSFRTMPRPPGERLATVATTNDVHFGETECGLMAGFETGPIFRTEPGEEPYPQMMNKAAIAEITALDPDVVLVKGDLTTRGTREEYDDFRRHYGGAFADRLRYVRGNHDVAADEDFGHEAPFEIVLPGAHLAVLDTSIRHFATGRVGDEQIEWLDELGSRADRPVLVFGHHHVWSPESRSRPDTYFGIHPDDSERLIDVVARRPALIGYFAGHTHRNRVRRFAVTGDVPWVEVACVKDFPGAWAEYRVFEGGVLQVFRRISAPEALEWTEKTKDMFGGLYYEYAFGAFDDRCFPIWPRR